MSVVRPCTYPHCSCEIHCDSEKPTPMCAYCGATDGLRYHHDGGGYIEPDYVCEGCFTPTDDGPCFDDLPAIHTASGYGDMNDPEADFYTPGQFHNHAHSDQDAGADR